MPLRFRDDLRAAIPLALFLEARDVKRTADDRRFSLMVRERDHFTCQRCGAVHMPTSQGLHSAHMFGRGKPATRLDPENSCALCYGCHRHLDTHPDLKREFFRLRLGDDVFEALELRSNRPRQDDPR